MKTHPASIAANLALITAVVFSAMLVVGISAGVTQQYFEFFQPNAEYANELLKHGNGLNLILGLDNLFIVLYTCTALFAIQAMRQNSIPMVGVLATVLIVAVGVLDFVENFHIYGFLQKAKLGSVIADDAISWQSVLSMLKWHLAYFGFFMIAFLIRPVNVVEKGFQWSLWVWFLPTGILVFVLQGTVWGKYVEWIRYANLWIGFVSMHLLMKRVNEERGE
jgi:hypothetical protein